MDAHTDLFGAANFIGGTHFANDVIIAQSLISSWAGNYTAPADPEYVTVRQLADRTPGISASLWLRAINQNRNLKLTSHDEVYLFNPRGVELTHKIVLEFKERRTQILRWIAMTVYNYLSPAMSFTLMNKLNKTPLSCYDYMVVLAPYALAMEATRHQISLAELNLARDMYRRLRTVVKSSFDWMDKESQGEAAKRVDAIIPIFGVPRHLNAPSRMDQEYRYLESFKGVFIVHLLNSLEGKSLATIKMYNGSFSKPVKHLRTTMYQGSLYPDAGPYFFPFYHVMMVTPRFLVPPFVLANSTAATYGGLGHAMATELFQYSKRTLDDNYAEVAGYQAAAQALRMDPSFQPEGSSPIRGLSNQQLFYVSLCYKWCSTKLKLQSNDTSHTRPDHRCNIALSTDRRFRNAFGCPEKPDMICDVL
ncbi:endothelin-converting enzyme, putative [Ixodes scapularis]|uniref:Endothelin-converting enzyme, putative n=1 Tax=Ixodes scapularis TaxID=6945 RepID=B7PL60_IXOSC|nr:endothelin-converting enzyme, putative [Ixodes scapularis]|eukprot:XP_002434508.1 endothelin-converting enzyme, putative [Ixodes scapularis]